MNNEPYIKSRRQQRAIEALLQNDFIQVKDIGPLIGALNARQTVFELRCQGFRGIILTRRFRIIDQDGKKSEPGEYYIPLELKPLAREALRKYTAKAATPKAASKKLINPSIGV